MQSFANKKILILGLGKTGISAAKKFLAFNIEVYLYDDNEVVLNNAVQTMESYAYDMSHKILPYILQQEFDYLFVSPGIPNNKIKKHPLIEYAIAKHIPIISDIAILQLLSSNATYIGITGTNGKSTTTALIGHILNTVGNIKTVKYSAIASDMKLQNKTLEIEAQTCGNIGIPVLDVQVYTKPSQIYVLELSSFQLDLMQAVNCHVSVFLNVTPDHMNCYLDVHDYANAKSKIFSRSHAMLDQRDCYNIISIDYAETQQIYQELVSQDSLNKKVFNIPFSREKTLEYGISLHDSKLVIANCFSIHGIQTATLSRNNSLIGKYNAENIAAAIAACLACGCDIVSIADSITSFKGLPHRMELVLHDKKNNIIFINDSKATNTAAAGAALAAFSDKKIHWIVGGICKDNGIEELSTFFHSIHTAYLIGSSTDNFAMVLSRYNVQHYKCYTLDNTMKCIVNQNVKDCIVLLSPACSSLDQWKNFEYRGEGFCSLVETLWRV